MGFIDEVKNPLDNDGFLKSMILLYAKQPLEIRKSGRYIYDELIRHPESENDADKHIYLWNYKKNVEQDTICTLLTDVLGYSKEESIKIYMDLFLDEKDETDHLKIDKVELLSKLEDKHKLDIQYDDKYMQMSIKDILKEVFHSEGIMGYHVHKSKLADGWIDSDSTVKFYINAGEYTYEFSKFFKQKCEEHELNYIYKVANPERDEETRADKMCIYMGLNDIEEYLEIVREVRKEHPEIEYKSPSPIMGSVDDWIGVGADPDNFQLASSYSDSRALLIENSLSAVLGNISEKKIMKMLEGNSDKLISILKAEIERRAAMYAITKNFAFDDIIVDALNKPPRERIEIYYSNRNKLFNNLPSEDRKQSVWERIKLFLGTLRERKNKSKSNTQGTNITFIPDRQLSYFGDEEHDGDEYKAKLQIDIDKYGKMPIEQTPVKREDIKKNNDTDLNHDDSDVWL